SSTTRILWPVCARPSPGVAWPRSSPIFMRRRKLRAMPKKTPDQKKPYQGLKQLGHQTPIPTSPEEAVLERVANPHKDRLYAIRFPCPEFTTLCPITGQPDFAHLVIDYAPKDWIIESKSLKLYFFSFRNQGTFHEGCTVGIGKLLEKTLK